MENNKDFNGVIYLVVLLMLSIVPLMSVVGNVLPAFAGIKVHQIWNGTIFLLSLIFIKRDNWILYVLLATFVIAMTLIRSNSAILVTVDHFSGIIVLFNLIGNHRFKIVKVNNLISVFILFSFIPVLIALLQILKVVPYEIGSSGYVNATMFQGEVVKRPNGGLFHPYELSIFTYMSFVLLFMWSKKVGLLLLSIPVLFLIKLKAGFALALLFILIVILKIYKLKWTTLLKIQKFSLKVAVFVILPSIIIFSSFFISLINLENSQEFLTGRGIIWQIYGTSLINSSWAVKFFGFWDISSIVSDSGLYYNKGYSPGPHNSYLEMLLYCGILGFIFLIVFFKRISTIIVKMLNHTHSMKLVYFSVILVLLTLAMTGDMLYTFYLYPAIMFMVKIGFNNNCLKQNL